MRGGSTFASSEPEFPEFLCKLMLLSKLFQIRKPQIFLSEAVWVLWVLFSLLRNLFCLTLQRPICLPRPMGIQIPQDWCVKEIGHDDGQEKQFGGLCEAANVESECGKLNAECMPFLAPIRRALCYPAQITQSGQAKPKK